MSDTTESMSSDADLLYCRIIGEVADGIGLCTECTRNPEISSIEDYVVCYSRLLHCVTYHHNTIDYTHFHNLFMAEKYLLNYFCDPEILSVVHTFKGKYTRYSKLRNEIGICAEKYFMNDISRLSCEQDIESLIFIIYKRNKIQSDNYMEYLLLTLFIRKEYSRFFKIYKKVDHTVFTNRLAILLSYQEDCEFEAENERCKIKNTINLEDPVLKYEISDILQLVVLENEDFEVWKTGINFYHDWNEKVRLWMKNRCETSCLLDKSMIEECIKHKRFEDGWTIYKLGSKDITTEYQKISILCIVALHHTSDDIWTDRLIEVMNSAIDKHEVSVCCELVQDIFHRIGGVPEKQRAIIIREFIKKIRVMENNEEIVTYIIKGINELCKKCINTETCDLCVEHANLIYKEWKKNNTGGFFFKSHSKFESEIYENMLDMCDTVEDCDGFRNVCKDLVNNEAKINKGIYKKLQSAHSKTCRDCRHGKCHVIQINDEQQLLYHIFNGFHL
ncbi:hypothetical protein P3W45_001407 [Vairimorpha bombi]